MMRRAHQVHESRAIVRAGDARSDHATTSNTWLVLGVADTIFRCPVHDKDGASTRLGLSKRVDQQTGSGQGIVSAGLFGLGGVIAYQAQRRNERTARKRQEH